MSNLKISRAEAFLATLFVSGGIVIFVIASNYRGVVEAKITTAGVEFRIDGREIPKSLPGALPPGRSSPEPSQDLLEEEAAKYRC
jgi:hypothetical protein